MKKLLMVEDDDVVSTIYRAKFVKEGYDVKVAKDGEAGIKQVAEFQPDIMILDLGLPKMDGVEVIKAVRAEPSSQNLPIVVLTNAYLTNRVKEAWAAGATRCVTKSECTPNTLVEILQRSDAQRQAMSQDARAKESAPVSPLYSAIAFPAGADLLKSLNSVDSFLEQAPSAIAKLRQKVHELLHSQRSKTAYFHVGELYEMVRSLSAKATLAGLIRFARMASALEAFLKELADRPELLTASSQRTVVQAIDFLDELQRHKGGGTEEIAVEGVLVVDDEPISRRAVILALEKVGLKSIDMDDPQAALAILTSTQFDLIFLDIDMPEMNGFELCRQIRKAPEYQKTPVVFVSGLTDFQSRAQSTLSGGNDLIAKPFHFLELGVKALIHLWRPQLSRI